MKKFLFIISMISMVSMILSSCTAKNDSVKSDKPLTATEKNIQEQKAMDAHKSVIPSKIMIADISGMTCEMGCGSTIRKNLYLNGGVAKVEYDFDEDRPDNKIKIYFDDKVIDEKGLIAAVANINDGQYEISNPTISDIK